MLSRFHGTHGRRLVVDVLREQIVVGGSEEIAEAINDKAEILGFSAGDLIIEEFAPDQDTYFILSGTVSIRVNGREIAVRTKGQQIGEMVVVDPTQPRSAAAMAEGEVVVARVPATTFIEVADANPRIWRNVARELADRLRQRNRFVANVNARPVVFVGCSNEALPIARAIESAFEPDPFIVKIWADSTFEASEFPIESLERELPGIDFAVLILSPEDQVQSRGSSWDAPRDNVVFELGLFMGGLGRVRTFLLCPEGEFTKIPTDLAGLTRLTYRQGPASELASAIAPASQQLREKILRAGPR